MSNQKEGEILMEKNPMAISPNLIEYFLIMGYEESYIQEKIIKNFNAQTKADLELAEQKTKKLNPESKILNEYKCRNLPSILFSLGSNFSESLEDGQSLIKDVFPVPPSVLYSIIDNFIYEPMANDIVFSNIQNNVVNIGYAHIFYESKNILENIRIYIPKAFVIISQYPFFNTFKNFCVEFLHQFKNKLLEIPLEIHLYNIINFIPAPIYSDISMTLFPLNDLGEIGIKCKNNSDLIHYNHQKEYKLSQLSGYRDLEIDISVIFCILSSDIIVEIFIQLLAGNSIAIFTNNITLLNMTIFIFQEMFYPLNNNESVKCLSPKKFFHSDMTEQNIMGFACSYEEAENNSQYKSLCDDDDEEQNEENKLFDCDFILDLDKKKLEYLETANAEKALKISDYVKKIISSSRDSNSIFEKSLKRLYSNLNEIAFKLTYGNKNQIIPDYFSKENQFNRKIQNLFYNFMLSISYSFFQIVSKYTNEIENTRNEGIRPREDTKLSEDEYLFYSSFTQTDYYRILNNFIGGYSKEELTLYQTPKIIFENLMNIKKLSEKSNISELSNNYYELIDEIYGKSNKTKEISFLNFYKYYKEKMAKNIYELFNSRYARAIINKSVKTNIKYYYEYQGVRLDKNIIFDYKYLIDALPQNEINELFNIGQNKYFSYDIFKRINDKISQKAIYNSIEQYLIKTKSIDFISIINFSILNIVALTMHERTAPPFILSIYNIFMKIPCSIRKYQEIFFSIALRLITKESKYNYQYFEKYFIIYEMCKELGLFLNDQLINLVKEISQLKGTNPQRYEEITNKRLKDIEQTKSDKLYSVDCKKKTKEIMAILQLNINQRINSAKLTFKSKFYNKNKKIEYKEQLSPLMIYDHANKMLENYLQDLNPERIDKNDFEEIIIHLIYYTEIMPDKFPKDINKFLFYCLGEKK